MQNPRRPRCRLSRNETHRPHSTILINHPQHQPSTSLIVNHPHQPSTSTILINHPSSTILNNHHHHQQSPSTLHINHPHQPSSSTILNNYPPPTVTINYPHQLSSSAILTNHVYRWLFPSTIFTFPKHHQFIPKVVSIYDYVDSMIELLIPSIFITSSSNSSCCWS